MITCQAVFIQYWNVTDGRTDRQTDRIPISISCWCTIKTRALRECKSPPTPKFQPKVIRDSNLDFRINPDPDVCRICPKMLWMHYLVGVSYFAKYGTNRPLIVWEILTNVQKSPTPQRWRKWKKWSRINNKKLITSTGSPLVHACQVWSTSVSAGSDLAHRLPMKEMKF